MLLQPLFMMTASLEGDTLVITLTGDLDITIRADLAGRLSQALDQQPARLVYDLTKVSFVDAGTLYLLIRAARRTSHKPVLTCPAPIVARLLQITGLETECTVTGDQQSA